MLTGDTMPDTIFSIPCHPGDCEYLRENKYSRGTHSETWQCRVSTSGSSVVPSTLFILVPTRPSGSIAQDDKLKTVYSSTALDAIPTETDLQQKLERHFACREQLRGLAFS
jgi:hypothetical protein